MKWSEELELVSLYCEQENLSSEVFNPSMIMSYKNFELGIVMINNINFCRKMSTLYMFTYSMTNATLEHRL